MVNIASLYTGVSAMSAQRRVLDVIGHNIANQATPGYHRQRADLQAITSTGTAALFAGQGDGPYGVLVSGMTRSIDELLAARAMREEAARADSSLTAVTMSRIEGLFPEPTDLGIAQQLAEFWSGWSDVANQPGGLAARSQLLERTATLAASFNRTALDLTSVRDQSLNRLAMITTDANDMARQVAALNVTINANPTAAFDLLDQRALVVERLAALVGGEPRPGLNGQIDIYIGGRALVSGSITQQITAVASDPAQMQWTADGSEAVPRTGEALALLNIINVAVPRYMNELNNVANKLVTEVNALHAAGFDQAGVGGGDFFEVPAPPATTITAATLALSANVIGQPDRIAAASVNDGPLDGDLARQIALLADSNDGPDAEYRALITNLAVETRAALRRNDIQTQVAAASRNDADSVGAVSIDEEMVALVGAQRAFEAAARFMTVVDELLGHLINRTGVVGR